MKICKSEKPEKTFKGFKRYISWVRFYARTTVSRYEYETSLTGDDYDLYAYCVHIMELDAIFYKKLGEEEKESLKYWHSHTPADRKPEFLDFYLQTSFAKYLEVFFSKPEPTINLKVLGKMMRLLREKKNRTKTELGIILGVDRTTVGYYEKGSRSPSINYIYKFCNYFGCSIDELLTLSIK
ncbi:helix-turn-helix domain-containing protein [Pseudobutyrivibrio sp.]